MSDEVYCRSGIFRYRMSSNLRFCEYETRSRPQALNAQEPLCTNTFIFLTERPPGSHLRSAESFWTRQLRPFIRRQGTPAHRRFQVSTANSRLRRAKVSRRFRRELPLPQYTFFRRSAASDRNARPVLRKASATFLSVCECKARTRRAHGELSKSPKPFC